MADYQDDESNVISSIFKDKMLESWGDNPEFVKYVSELTSFGIERLARETDHLEGQKSFVDKQTEDLAFNNYKTFIQTAECSHDIYKDFQIIEGNVLSLLDKLPRFSEDCQTFLESTKTINQSRKSNTLTLQKHTQLLEILEVPQLMDTCVRNKYYDEALELSAYVRRLDKKYNNIPIIKSICEEVRRCSQLLLAQLLQQLRSDLQLPACLRVIGFLRHMDIFTEVELRLKFLQARDTWFENIISNIPAQDAYTHINKVIEASRVHLFDIITQYKAIFTDDEHFLQTDNSGPRQSQLLQSWIHSKISQFLKMLRDDLAEGVGSRLESLLGQCMYFGLSFSRVGCDFRGLIAEIFQNAAVEHFTRSVELAAETYEQNMETFSLILRTRSDTIPSTQPTSLLKFRPLALLCNDILAAFNDLRVCAPLNIAPRVTRDLENCLSRVADGILNFHRLENSTFTVDESAAFVQMCESYCSDLLPYINTCLDLTFPHDQINKVLGYPISTTTSKKSELYARIKNLSNVNIEAITEPLKQFIKKPEDEIQLQSTAGFSIDDGDETTDPEKTNSDGNPDSSIDRITDPSQSANQGAGNQLAANQTREQPDPTDETLDPISAVNQPLYNQLAVHSADERADPTNETLDPISAVNQQPYNQLAQNSDDVRADPTNEALDPISVVNQQPADDTNELIFESDDKTASPVKVDNSD